MNCSTLTVNQFITALLGDRSYVGDKWEDIYNEYVGLRENKQSSYILDLVKEATYLQAKEFIINKCVEVLARVYSRDLVLEVKQCGCKGSFNWDNKATYAGDLKAALKQAEKYKRAAARKEADLKEYRERHAGDKIDRTYFTKIGVTLWRFMGNRIDFDITTVAEFCQVWNEYDKFCEASQQNKSADIADEHKQPVN